MQASAADRFTTSDQPPMAPDRADAAAEQARLVSALRRTLAGTAAGTRVLLIETHISYVLVTGGLAYKIKKAVGLPFLDFRTLAARRFYCDEELRLNRRYAPQLYLDVVPITGSLDAPVMGGAGTAIEFAVKMREFPQAALANEALARGELTTTDIDALAGIVAESHRIAGTAAAGGPFGAPDRVLDIALRNLGEIRPLLTTDDERADLDALRSWTVAEHARRTADIARRRDAGYVRECHGDLHLGNIAFVDGALTLFDCIEFNEEMRWIDVMSEVAFTAMDLRDRGRPDFSHRFLDRYLAITGDYIGLGVLRFYLVYRAAVRAKIARMRAAQLDPGNAKTEALEEYRGYLALARSYTDAPKTAVVITHGLSGSGKTTLSQALLERMGAVRIRTDVERKRGIDRNRRPRGAAEIEGGLYAPEATRQTYARVRALARSAVEAGFVAIVDGAFLARWQRQLFRELAAELRVPFVIVSFAATAATLRKRIERRMREGKDASEADLAVLEHQLQAHEPLGTDETDDVVAYDTESRPRAAYGPARWDLVVARIDAGRAA